MSATLAWGSAAMRGMLLLVLGAAGCALPSSDAGADPTGVLWRWVALEGDEPLEIERPGDYTLELHDDGRYHARADCNQASGSYTLEGGRLRLGPAATTLAACPPGSHAPRYLALLGRVSGLRREGERLRLTLEDGAGTLVFSAARELELAGSAWAVRAVNNGRGGVASVVIGTALDARFAADGSLAGSAGCNRYTARFEVEGEALRIGPAAATRRACAGPPGIMEQEAAFLAALGTVARHTLRGGRLQLRTAEGALAVDLIAAVTGTLAVEGGAQIPAGARVRVVLEDVSRADAPSRVLGEEWLPVREAATALPFEVAYDPSDVDPSGSHSVRVTVEDAGGETLFRTTRANPVLTRDHPTLGVTVRLEPAR